MPNSRKPGHQLRKRLTRLNALPNVNGKLCKSALSCMRSQKRLGSMAAEFCPLKHLCKLFIFYLGDVSGFRFHQPGASHDARFLADALYMCTGTLRMTWRKRNLLNEEEKKKLEVAAFFVSVCYAPWFLKS
jgi:hypothetical protein